MSENNEKQNIPAKILIVDDEPDLELLVRQRFRRKILKGEFELIFAYNGAQALEKLQEDPEIYVVLTDINMPEMDGLTLLAKLSNLNPILRTVIVSAYGDMENIRTAMNNGAFDFLIKPIDFQDLETTINKTLQAVEQLRKAEQAQALEIENRRKTEELERAKAIQLSMVPQMPPQIAHLEISADMKTATEVGGDYYDFFPQDDGSLYIVTGDATGHGMAAGIMVSMTKAALNTLDVQSPDEMIKQLNRTIRRINLGRIKMALNVTYIRADGIEFSSAAMPSAFLYHSDTGEVEEILVPGLPLGSLENADYSLQRMRFEPRDAFVLISDGLEERRNDAEEILGDEAIRQCIAEFGNRSAEEIKNALVDLGENWANGKPNEDDVTLVVVKRRDKHHAK